MFKNEEYDCDEETLSIPGLRILILSRKLWHKYHRNRINIFGLFWTNIVYPPRSLHHFYYSTYALDRVRSKTSIFLLLYHLSDRNYPKYFLWLLNKDLVVPEYGQIFLIAARLGYKKICDILIQKRNFSQFTWIDAIKQAKENGYQKLSDYLEMIYLLTTDAD